MPSIAVGETVSTTPLAAISSARREPTVSGQDLLRQGHIIVADCPKWEIRANDKTLAPVSINNGAQWCRRLARWTESVLDSQDWRPVAHVRMNRPLRFIRTDSEERQAYEAVVRLLRQGRERVSKLPVPTSEHQLMSHGLIEGRLGDPLELCRELMAAIGRGFRGGGPAWINPVLVETLTSLDQAHRWLGMYGAAGREADWRQAYDQLRAVLESEENSQSNPWTWLGVNVLSCLEASRCDVFEGLPAAMQNAMGIGFLSGNIGPTPESVTTLCAALDLVLADLEKLDRTNRPGQPSETGGADKNSQRERQVKKSSTVPQKARGRPRKYSDAICQKAGKQFDNLYAKSNDATGAWNTVADNLNFPSGEAARKAYERYRQSQLSGQNGHN